MERLKVAALALALIFTGIAIGYYTDRPPKSVPRTDVSKRLLDEISADSIDAVFKRLGSIGQDRQQAEWIRDRFVEYGLEASIVSYDALLSFPSTDEPNRVQLRDAKGEANFTTQGVPFRLLAPEENSTCIAAKLNAKYSGTGSANGSLVYANYGRECDYDYLDSLNISVEGKIVLARYGATFRANIVVLAEQRGAAGVILYSDPIDFAQDGSGQHRPDSWWMPGMAVRSGTVTVTTGELLTPFYPSIDGAYRIPQWKAGRPKIPVQPIGYDEAEVFLRALEEVNRAPDAWQGGLNVTYYLGPQLKTAGWTVEMNVRTANRNATVHNVIGLIRGDEEPDRYVVVGSHRDACILGAVDSSSGTAAMMEMARAIAKLKRDGWSPRRSLIFASWGGQQYGLVGSQQWVEEHAKVLSQRAVAYLNVDVAVSGNYSLRGSAAPILRSVIVDSSKKVANPNPDEVAQSRRTVYDTWMHRLPDVQHAGQPRLNLLASGSDYAGFMYRLGVPALDLTYTYEQQTLSHHVPANIIDKGFLYHRAVTQLWAEIASNLTDSVVLPMDIDWYATYLNEQLASIQSTYGQRLADNGATLDYFEKSVRQFQTATGDYSTGVLQRLDINNAMAVRRVNDQLLQLERQLIDPHGLPGRPHFNHLVFAPSSNDNDASTSFSGLTDLLQSVGNATQTEKPDEWEAIKQHLSVIAFHIGTAAKSLSDVVTTDRH